MQGYQQLGKQIENALSYNRETGRLTWLHTGGRVKAGEDAGGYVERRREVIVTFAGYQIPAFRVIWFLVKGQWPAKRLKAKDGNRANLEWSNIFEEPEALSYSAQYQRARRRRATQIKDRVTAIANSADGMSGVLFHSRSNDRENLNTWWTASYPLDKQRSIPLGRFANYDSAVQAVLERQDGIKYLEAHPVGDIPADKGHQHAAGNPKAPTLFDMDRAFAYDPDVGAIYRRESYHETSGKLTPIWYHYGRHATIPGPGRSLLVTLDEHPYAAHNLAWFLAKHHWPKRKDLRFRNGDRSDLRLSNMYLQSEEPENEYDD